MQTTKKYWLRGGIVCGLFYILFFYLTYSGVGSVIFGDLSLVLAVVLALPAMWFFPCPDLRCIDLGIPSDFISGMHRFFMVGMHWIFIVNLIIYIVVGGFMGWLYGKMRNKNKIV